MSLHTNNNLVPLADIPALVLPALGETLIMVGIVMAIVVAVGIPLGAAVHNLAPGGLFEHRAAHQTLSWVISIGRSLPFLILMASIMPFTRLITGTNIGIAAAVAVRTRCSSRASRAIVAFPTATPSITSMAAPSKATGPTDSANRVIQSVGTAAEA